MKAISLLMVMLAGLFPNIVLAMDNYDNPRILRSFRDNNLPPHADILRVKARMKPEQGIVFEVKLRNEATKDVPEDTVYALEITQGETPVILLASVVKESDKQSAAWRLTAYQEGGDIKKAIDSGELARKPAEAPYDVRYIDKGIEFLVPLERLDFTTPLTYDAYTLNRTFLDEDRISGKLLDHANKGRKSRKTMSPIMLFNTLCISRG